jgi:cyclopropane fatty-acyl-phospholipid synthase-like methyltransferase
MISQESLMSTTPHANPLDQATTEERAWVTKGQSSEPIYRVVEQALAKPHLSRGTILDLGCGAGDLWPYVHVEIIGRKPR